MRQIPNRANTNTVATLAAGHARPPLDVLPDDVAELLVERDQLGEKVQAATFEHRRLFDPACEVEAKRADDDAATAAARAGKPLPKPKAVAALQEERDAAQRALNAFTTAFAQLTQEADDARNRHRYEIPDPKPAAVARITALANELADEIEAVIAADAVRDWMAGHAYYTRTDVRTMHIDPSLNNLGLDARSTQAIPVRQLLTATVAVALESEN